MPRGLEQFKTVVRNPSTTVTRTYSFLPPHGRTLRPGQQLEFVGDLQNMFKQPGSKARYAALQLAISSGALQVISTPPPVMFDEHTGVPHSIGISNGSIVITGVPTDFDNSSLQSLSAGGNLTPG